VHFEESQFECNRQDGKRCTLCQIIYFDHLLCLDAHLDSGTDSQALRAEYCIVGIPHNTAI